MRREEVSDNIFPECEGNAPVVLSPPDDVSVGVRPQQVAEKAWRDGRRGEGGREGLVATETEPTKPSKFCTPGSCTQAWKLRTPFPLAAINNRSAHDKTSLPHQSSAGIHVDLDTNETYPPHPNLAHRHTSIARPPHPPPRCHSSLLPYACPRTPYLYPAHRSASKPC